MIHSPESSTQEIASSYDVVVVGAGPAGCTAATLIADQGHSVLLLEREAFPRFHVGESLMPETYWTMKRLGIWDRLVEGGYVRKNGVQFVSHNDKESKPFFFQEFDPRECAETWHVERRVFDQMMFDNAREKGATCRDRTRVMSVDLDAQVDDDRFRHSVVLQTADGQSATVRTKVVVDATGQSALIANHLSLREFDPDLKKAAIWTYFEGAKRNGTLGPEVTCILHTEDKQNWFWYIPLSNGTVSVGVVGDHVSLLKKGRGTPQEVFEQERQQCPGLERRLNGAQRVDEFHVAKEFTYKTKQHSGDGWVLIGDAYGFIDPIYSSGVFLALKSGEMAADAVSEGLQTDDLSANQLGKWFESYDRGVVLIRKLVDAFYTEEFSFGDFMKEFPHHGKNLTDLLVGRVYEGEPGQIFEDMDPWIAGLKQKAKQAKVQRPEDTAATRASS